MIRVESGRVTRKKPSTDRVFGSGRGKKWSLKNAENWLKLAQKMPPKSAQKTLVGLFDGLIPPRWILIVKIRSMDTKIPAPIAPTLKKRNADTKKLQRGN